MTLSAGDRLALADVVHGYAAALDDRRFDDAVDLFTDTAELRLPDPPAFLEPVRVHSGRDAIRSALRVVAEVLRTQHAIVGEVYASQGADGARGRIACEAHHWTQHGEGVSDVVWHLRYDDEYVRTASGWRIAVRALSINAIETRPVRRIR